MPISRSILRVIAVGSALASATPVAFAAEDDLAAIRAQMKQMQSDYDARMRALEKRLQKAEDDVIAARASARKTNAPPRSPQHDSIEAQAVPIETATSSPSPAPVVAISRAPVSASAFNPGIAVVLNGGYSAVEKNPSLAKVPGFVLDAEGGLPGRGFSIGESEIAIFANVDPYFSANLNLSFNGENEVGVEEAYIQTQALGNGLTLRLGRFFSGIGYLNDRHAHDWDFVSAPLPYRVLLANQYGDDGAQLRWIVPIDQFLEIGAEVFRGDGFPGGNSANRWAGAYSAFARTGGDLDESWSWLASLSYLHTHADRRDNDGDVFSGSDQYGVFSGVLKWAPAGNPVQQNLILSGELFYGRQAGDFNLAAVEQNRLGWYVQGVYQFMPQWRIGLRHDALHADDLGPSFSGSTLDRMGHDPSANSLLLEFDTSEFGRFRAEYTRDDSDVTANNIVTLQYTVIIGPHGAHRF